MKLTVEQSALAKVLPVINRAVAGKTTLPILSNVLLTAEDDKLRLAGTNLEISIETSIDAKVAEKGTVTIPAKLLNDYVSSLPSGEITMTLNEKNNTVKLSCAGNTSNIKGLPADDYPDILSIDDNCFSMHLEPSDISAIVGLVCFCANPKDARVVLNGAAFFVEPNCLKVAALDGFRVAEKMIPHGSQVDEPFVLVIPVKTLTDVAKISSDEGCGVDFIVAKNRQIVFFHTEKTNLASRLIDGAFPRYGQLLPTEFTGKVTLLADDLLQAVKRSSLFVDSEVGSLTMKIKDGGIDVTSIGAEVGENESTVQAHVEGSDLSIKFNAMYLTQMCGALYGNTITMQTIAPEKGMIVRLKDDDTYLHFVLPMVTKS